MTNDIDFTSAVQSQGRVVGIRCKSLIGPARASVEDVMDLSIVIGRPDRFPVFNIGQMPCPIRSHDQARALVNVDAIISRSPHVRRADGLYIAPGPRAGASAGEYLVQRIGGFRDPGDRQRIVERRKSYRRMVRASGCINLRCYADLCQSILRTAVGVSSMSDMVAA